jgi:hypothetical protein
MSTGSLIVVVLAIAATAVVVLWFLLGRQHPETAAAHREPPRTGSALHHGDVDDRPAGPGAEADGVGGPGEPIPGPSRHGDEPPR